MFLLRAMPYLMCVISGVILFTVDFYLIQDPSYSDLLSGITAGLMSIPIIFLIYDNFNRQINAKLNAARADELSGDINIIVMDVMKYFFVATGGRGTPGIRAIQKMVDMPPATIRKKLRLGRKDVVALRGLKNRLDMLVYRAGAANVFDASRFEIAMTVLRNLSHIVSILEYEAGRAALVKYTEGLFDASDDWLDGELVTSNQ